MVWNRKKKTSKEEKMNAHISVIPEIFYGGEDPLIYLVQKKAPEKQKPKKVEIKKNLPTSKKKLLVVLITAFVVVVVTASLYYVRQMSLVSKKDGKIVERPSMKEETAKEPVKEEPKEEPEIVEEQPPAEEPVEPVEEKQTTIVFPSILLQDSPDIDIDSLTDEEEEIFGTDSGIWDSDKDGYYDGQEVFNLYNPKGFAPVKIIDSGLVKEYINPNWQYRVYYPAVWVASGVDSENNSVIFSSISGDFIEVRAYEKKPNENFTIWFSKNIEGQSFTDLALFNNRFKIDGYKRKDSLVAYFIGNNAVFVMFYQTPGNAADIPYRHVMQLMSQSFRPSAVFTDLPGQTMLPPVPETENAL